MTSPSIASVAQGIWNARIDFSAIKSSIGSVSFSGVAVTLLTAGIINSIARAALPFYNQQVEDSQRNFAARFHISAILSFQIVTIAITVSAIALTAYFGLLPPAFALQAIQILSIEQATNLGAYLIEQVANKVIKNPNVSALVSGMASVLFVAKGALSFGLAPASLVLGQAKIRSIFVLLGFVASQLPKPQEARTALA